MSQHYLTVWAYTFSYKDDSRRFGWITDLLRPGGDYVLDIRAENYQIDKYSEPKQVVDRFHLDSEDLTGDVEVETSKH